jgi:hypothetical protein
VFGTDAAGSDTDIISDGLHPTQIVHTAGYEDYLVPALAAIAKPRYVLTW